MASALAPLLGGAGRPQVGRSSYQLRIVGL